ncbi:PKD domain-containing protein, partial [Patescibacteria group bacterium]|nr:PKD domain-containing protein [Patescibacteria group bacterium]
MIRSIGAILFIALLAVGCSAEVTGPNRAPHAEAGADQVTEVGRPVLLDGSKSWDPDGDPINHTWDLVAAPDGAITSALTTHGETATLNPPVPGVWLVRLVVTDGKLDSEPDIVQVRVMKSCTDEGPYGDPTCTDGVDNDCDDATDADDTDCWCTSDNDCDSGQLCRLIDGVCVDDLCDPNPCNGRGTCDDATGQAVCTCETGYTGNTCNTCDTGYHPVGNDCVVDEVCQANSCSGHGTCSTPSGVIECSCDTGYTGVACSSCDTGYHEEGGDCVADEVCQPDSCNFHGTCSTPSGVIECSCNPEYQGSICDECAAGYHWEGNDCVLDQNCQPNTCNGHGQCDDVTGVPVCTCDTGYTGVACSSCDTGYHPVGNDCVVDEVCQANSCSGHGTCSTPSGVIECTCETGYTGNTCNTCDTGYHPVGNDCVVDEVCQANSCSG